MSTATLEHPAAARRTVPFSLYDKDTLHLCKLDFLAAGLGRTDVFTDDPRAVRRERVLVGSLPNV